MSRIELSRPINLYGRTSDTFSFPSSLDIDLVTNGVTGWHSVAPSVCLRCLRQYTAVLPCGRTCGSPNPTQEHWVLASHNPTNVGRGRERKEYNKSPEITNRTHDGRSPKTVPSRNHPASPSREFRSYMYTAGVCRLCVSKPCPLRRSGGVLSVSFVSWRRKKLAGKGSH